MNLLNQFSYPLLILGLLIGLYWVLRRLLHLRLVYVLGMQAAVLLIGLSGFALLRPNVPPPSEVERVWTLLQNQRPTFIEFFSNYCIGCMALEPSVKALVAEIEQDFNVLRIDIHTEVGREIRRQMAFSFTPEFVIFDSAGEEIWRDHLLPSVEVLQAARQ